MEIIICVRQNLLHSTVSARTCHTCLNWSVPTLMNCLICPVFFALSVCSFFTALLYLLAIAGQCRTSPWLAVPDWSLMPEYRCRTDYKWNTGVNADAGLTFYRHSDIPAFAHCIRVYTFPPPAVWGEDIYFPESSQCVCGGGGGGCILFHHQQGVNVRVHAFPLSTVWT